MKRIFLALTFLALAAPAYAQQTKAQLNTEVTTNYPDNTVGAITPAVLRSTTNDMIASWQQAPLVNAQTGTTYTIALADYGKMVTTNNGSAVAVTLPQATGSFATFNFYLKNLGAGTATITPTTSTINGTTSIAVAQNESVFVVSDGANYQVMTSASSAISFANPTGSVGCTAVNGAASTAMRSDGAPALNLAASCTFTGNPTYAPTTGTGITITTPAGSPVSFLGLVITNSANGSPTPGSQQATNQVSLTDNSVNATGSIAAFQSQYSAAATANWGNGIGLLGVATTSANTNTFYGIGVQGQGFAQHTATGPTGLGGAGQAAGGNFLCHLAGGATGYFSCFGLEINTSIIPTGANAPKFKAGILIAQNVDDAARGATYDAAFAVSSHSAIKWKNAFLMGNMAGLSGFATDSVLFATTGSQQVTSFIDFSSFTCSGGSEINFTNFVTACTGVTTITRSSIGTTSTDAMVLTNATAAGAGAQQFSPRLRLTGAGWRTNGGGASEVVDWAVENQPVQGTADPVTNLVFNFQVNATGYTPHTSFIVGPNGGAPAAPADSLARFVMQRNVNGSSLYGVDSGGGVYAWCVSCTSTIFGTATSVPVDFYTNNTLRFEIAAAATHYRWAQATPPALTSCGTSPTISAGANDIYGTVTMGTGTPTGCVITFNVAYNGAPSCLVTWRATPLASQSYTISASAITLTQTATSSNLVDYHCSGT